MSERVDEIEQRTGEENRGASPAMQDTQRQAWGTQAPRPHVWHAQTRPRAAQPVDPAPAPQAQQDAAQTSAAPQPDPRRQAQLRAWRLRDEERQRQGLPPIGAAPRDGQAQDPAAPQAEPVQPARQQKKKNRVLVEIREWLIALGVALVIALVLTQVIFVNAQVPSGSMEDTILVGDRVVGFRLSYVFEEPRQGDIVIFKFPDDEKQLFVKRLIGMPGQTVEVQDGMVYIDGQERPDLNSHVKGEAQGNYGPWTVPEDCYFMMGDNRTYSHDSRFWKNTFVKREALVAKAVFRLFPGPGTLE